MADMTDAHPLEEQLAHCGGADCKCMAYYRTECACDADWTPAEVYRLRDEVARLQSALATHVDRVCELTSERDALQARIDGSQIVKATSAGNIRPEPRMTYIGKRVALVVLEDGK